MRRNKFGFTGESRLFISLSEKLTNGFYVLSAGIGTVLMTVGSSFVSSFDFGTKWNKSVGFWGSASIISFNPWTALTVGSLLLLIGSIGTYKDLDNLKKENKKLKEENNTVHSLKDSLNSTQEDCETLRDDIYGLHKKLVRTWLKEAFRQLGLNTYDRVTIYFEYEKQFFLLARHSLNPKLAEEHRQKFPLNQGALSLAWQHKGACQVFS